MKNTLPIYPKHFVYTDSENNLVTITILNNKLFVSLNSIEPNEMKKIDEFEADSHSDFNWGIVKAVMDNDLNKSILFKECKEISKSGL